MRLIVHANAAIRKLCEQKAVPAVTRPGPPQTLSTRQAHAGMHASRRAVLHIRSWKAMSAGMSGQQANARGSGETWGGALSLRPWRAHQRPCMFRRVHAQPRCMTLRNTIVMYTW